MRSRLWLAGLLAALAPAALFGEIGDSGSPRLTGSWKGSTLVKPARIEVDFRLVVTREDPQSFAGSLSFPTQGPKEYALETLTRQGNTVAFSSTDEENVVSAFEGQLSADGREVKGIVKVRGKEYPFAMTRDEGGSAPRSPSLWKLSAEGQELKELFNLDDGKVRLLLILAPTNGTCRMGANLVERYVLDRIDDPRLAVYVVWEPRDPADTEEKARGAARFLSDPRVSHFWAGNGFAGKEFKNVIGFTGESPAIDVYLLFPAEGRWTGPAPAPTSFMHYRPELPKERAMHAENLAGEVEALLRGPAAVAGSRSPQ